MIRIRKILVGHDFSSFSDAALLEAVRIAKKVGADIHVAYVEVLHRDLSSMQVSAGSRSSYLKQELESRFAAVDGEIASFLQETTVHFEILRDVAAGPALLAYADENDVDLIIVGTHGRRGFRRMLMGSVAEEVIRKAPCPVMSVRDNLETTTETPHRTIVAPVDFSRHSMVAVRTARELAALMEVDVVVVHVLEETLHPAFYNTGMFSQYEFLPDIEERTEKELRRFYEEAGGPQVGVEYAVRRGHAVREINALAKEIAPAMIVMATHGLTGLDHFLLGSVTEKVMRHAECPVFAVKSFGKHLVESASAPMREANESTT